MARAKKMTLKEKKAAADAAAKVAEGTAANTATEQTTPAETTKVEVVGDMESLIAAFGTVEAVIEACQNPAQRKFVELYEFGDEPGAKGAKMKWGKVAVISHDVVVGGGYRKVWIMMTTPAIISAYRASLRGKKFFQQSLEDALQSFKRLEESHENWLKATAFKAEVKASQADRAAKFAATNLLDSRNWIPLAGLGKNELAEIIARLMPRGETEKPGFLQAGLDMAAESVGEFLADLEAAITEKGLPKSFGDYRTMYESVQQAWWNGRKVVPHAHGLKLVTRRFAGETFGVVLYEDDVAAYVDAMDKQFDARQTEMKAKFEKNGREFTAAMRPQVELKDPVYGFLLFLLFGGPKEAVKLTEKKAAAQAKREAEEAARVAANAKAVKGFSVGLGAVLQRRYGATIGTLEDLAGVVASKPARKPKGDRRHNPDDN